MSVFKLTPRLIKYLEAKIGSAFDSVKARLLGPRESKSIFVTYDHSKSIPGMYEAASKEEGGYPSLEELNTLVDTSKNYLDALKLKATNKVVKEVESHLQTEATTPESVEKVLQNAWKDVTKQLSDIVDAETQAAKNIGLLNGIIRQNAAFKVERPVVYFITPVDDLICDDCLRLHLMPDRVTPRLWYLDELKHTWGKHGDQFPSVLGQHPHCRAHMVTILPNYGFTTKGRITFVGKGHSEIEKQRG